MITWVVLWYAAKVGAKVEGGGAFVIADLILAWIVVNGLVKILGGA